MTKSSLQSIFKEELQYAVTGRIWIECEQERFFGHGRAELLQRIEETGSINKAAKQMGMSYKKAWEMTNAMNMYSAKPFVIMHTGGEKGGGSVITDEARQLIAYHQQLRQRFLEFLENETKQLSLL